MNVETTNFGSVWVWPHCPRIPMREAFEWGTYVSESYNGQDVVTQVRNAPRWFAELESVLSDGKAAAYAVAYAGAGAVWAMPVWAEAERVTVSAAAASVPVSVGHYHTDGLALLWSSSQQWELLEISGTPTTSISLLSAVSEDYTNALVMPVRAGRLIQATTVNQNSVHSWFRLQFMSDENKVLASTEPTQYQGDDLYTEHCPLLEGDGVPDEIQMRQDTLDSYTGLVSYNTPWSCARRQRTFRRYLADADARMDLLDWLHRRAGRYRPFWMPTWSEDLHLASTGALTTAITVLNDGYTTCRNHIAVRTTGGTWLPREVTGAEVDGSNLNLTLDTSLGIDASAVERISYLGLHRLAADRIEIETIGAGRAFAGIPVLEAQL